jgi:hypothetical protein
MEYLMQNHYERTMAGRWKFGAEGDIEVEGL